MIVNIALQLAGKIISSNDEFPKPSQKAIENFNKIKSAELPNPQFRNPSTDAEKTMAKKALFNRLLVAKEGVKLISDLCLFAEDAPFKIKYHLGKKHPAHTGAAGFTDIPYEDDLVRDHKLIQIWCIYPDTNPTDFRVEVNDNVAAVIKDSASRMSLVLFHELMHVYYEYADFDDTPDFKTGHNLNEKLETDYEKLFLKRIRQYRKEIIELEKLLP